MFALICLATETGGEAGPADQAAREAGTGGHQFGPVRRSRVAPKSPDERNHRESTCSLPQFPYRVFPSALCCSKAHLTGFWTIQRKFVVHNQVRILKSNWLMFIRTKPSVCVAGLTVTFEFAGFGNQMSFLRSILPGQINCIRHAAPGASVRIPGHMLCNMSGRGWSILVLHTCKHAPPHESGAGESVFALDVSTCAGRGGIWSCNRGESDAMVC